jgi:hypothetical protein
MVELHTRRGKWSMAGVPHKGWICVDVDDLGEPSETCAMCESTDIRYVHYMKHPDYPHTLGVGCVCAEHMEGDYVAPRAREEHLRKRARRRVKWEEREWKISSRGNPYMNTEGYNLTVFERGSGRHRHWVVRVTNRTTDETRQGKGKYSSAEEAKGASLDALIWAKEHMR